MSEHDKLVHRSMLLLLVLMQNGFGNNQDTAMALRLLARMIEIGDKITPQMMAQEAEFLLLDRG